MPHTLQADLAIAGTAFPHTADASNPIWQNSLSTESEAVKVLLISPLDDDHRSLTRILQHSKWKYCAARSRAEALTFLRDNAVPVLICESDLIDGTWRDLLDRTTHMQHAPLLIVTSRSADDALWAEVLNLGGYNVLAKPFDSREVFHVVANAWLHWKNQGKYPTSYASTA
jgi:DNA-binding NtrC family response regulator